MTRSIVLDHAACVKAFRLPMRREGEQEPWWVASSRRVAGWDEQRTGDEFLHRKELVRSTAQRNVLVCSLLAVLLSGACAPTAHRVTVASGHTKLEITALTFFGVDVVREEQLRDVVRTKPARWWPWAKPRYFDAHTFAADLQRIMAFYKAHGYPDARITSHAVDIDHEEHDVRVTIVIDEGEHVRAPEVAWRPDVPA